MGKYDDKTVDWIVCKKEMVYRSDDDGGRVPVEFLARGFYRGFEFAVVNNGGSYPCGYVNVSGTKLEGIRYSDSPCSLIVCHGWLTYGASGLLGQTGWWIGWDYVHFGDYVPHVGGGKRWTIDEVVEECKSVIRQVLEMKA